MKWVKTEKTDLVEKLIPSSTKLLVREWKDSNGNNLDYTNWGSIPFNVTVIDGADSETIKINNINRLSDRVELIVASSGRELADTPPYTGTSTGKTLSRGSFVFTSNDPDSLSKSFQAEIGGDINAPVNFNQDVTYQGNTSNPKHITTVEFVQGLIAGVQAGENVSLATFTQVAGELIPANTIVKWNSIDGRWYVADKDDTDIDTDTVFGFVKTGVNIGATIIDGIVLKGQTTLGGLAVGKVFLGDNGAVATTGNFQLGWAGNDGVLAITAEIINQQLTNALKGNDGSPPSDTNRFVTENGLLIFGNGSDGDVTISTDTTLAEDKFYNVLTINDGVTLTPDGYKIFARKLIRNGTGKIVSTGGNGGNGGNASFSSSTGGHSGSAGTAGSTPLISTTNGLPFCQLAPAGAVGGDDTDSTGGVNGNAGNNATYIAINQTNGANGGPSGSSGGRTGRSGGAGGNQNAGVMNTSFKEVQHFRNLLNVSSGSYQPILNVSPSSGSGAGGQGWATSGIFYGGGGGGGAGGSGGIVAIYVGDLVLNNTNIFIDVSGSNGGNGGNNSGSFSCGGGGGGGGNGGSVLVVYNHLDGVISTATTVDVNGGTGGGNGSGGSFGNVAQNGNSGKLFKLKI